MILMLRHNMLHSKNTLKQLLISNPKELAKILTNSNINNSLLSFGVEILGEEIYDKEITLPVFKKLLKHPNALVRESAVIGTFAFFNSKTIDADILELLNIIKLNDPSFTIKVLVKDLLENY